MKPFVGTFTKALPSSLLSLVKSTRIFGAKSNEASATNASLGIPESKLLIHEELPLPMHGGQRGVFSARITMLSCCATGGGEITVRTVNGGVRLSAAAEGTTGF